MNIKEYRELPSLKQLAKIAIVGRRAIRKHPNIPESRRTQAPKIIERFS